MKFKKKKSCDQTMAYRGGTRWILTSNLIFIRVFFINNRGFLCEWKKGEKFY